ncbi:MAG: hypothetical protein CMH83_15905 [Nocardioides sp.]|nr:hypothetical protein [Nocardioides sp.]
MTAAAATTTPAPPSPASHRPSPRERVRRLVDDRRFEHAIIAVIVANSISLGLETTSWADGRLGEALGALDRVFIAVFVVELLLKIVARGTRFPRDPWNLFDLVVVGIALLPATGPLSVLRALRVLRVLRLVSSLPSLRRIVAALAHSLPGIGSIAALLSLVFYVAAVMATSLFSATFPEWFGSVGDSLYTLFQVMTLESWSMGIVRPVMEVHPWAWMFFVPFILVASFTVLNLFIAVIVDSMATLHDQMEKAEEAEEKAGHATLAASPAATPADIDLVELRRTCEQMISQAQGVLAVLDARERASYDDGVGDAGGRD